MYIHALYTIPSFLSSFLIIGLPGCSKWQRRAVHHYIIIGQTDETKEYFVIMESQLLIMSSSLADTLLN